MVSSQLRRVSVSLVSVAVVLAIAACSSSDEKGGKEAPDRLAKASGTPAAEMTVNYNTAPATLDPGNLCNAADGIVRNFYSALVRFGSKPGPGGTRQSDQNKIEPDLAESWKMSSDGLTYTFVIRKDAKFQSGRPVDAEAVEFSWRRALDMGLCSAYGVETSDVGNVASFRATDPHTFVVRLKKPNPSLLKSWATATLGIVDPSVVEEHGGVKAGEPNEYLATHSAGSGPYVVADYQPGRRLVMEANPDYFGDAPLTKKITVNFVTSDSTLLLQAKNATADVTLGLSKVGVASLRSDPNVLVETYRSTNTEQVILNWEVPALGNRDVRKALAMAVPYADIIEKVAHGLAEPFTGPILPTMPGYVDELGKPHAYDVEQAKKLIAESGVPTPIRFTLNIPQGNSVHEQLATILQDAWREIGVEITIRKLDQAAYTGALFGNKAQASIRHDGPFVNEPEYFLGYDMQCAQPGTENTGNVCIKPADEALEHARRTLDPAERDAALRQVIEAWQPEEPKIFLYLDEEAVVLSRAVTSFTYDPTLGDFAAMAKSAQ